VLQKKKESDPPPFPLPTLDEPKTDRWEYNKSRITPETQSQPRPGSEHVSIGSSTPDKEQPPRMLQEGKDSPPPSPSSNRADRDPKGPDPGGSPKLQNTDDPNSMSSVS